LKSTHCEGHVVTLVVLVVNAISCVVLVVFVIIIMDNDFCNYSKSDHIHDMIDLISLLDQRIENKPSYIDDLYNLFLKSDCMFIFLMLLSSNHFLFQPKFFVYYIASQLHAIVFGEVPMRNLAFLNWACQIPN
jgi:hypothetical protein